MSSSKIVIKNSMIGAIAQMVSMLIGFLTQRLFVRFLGLEIVGINSVIAETLGMLAFAELGVGTAITYRLYKPLVQKDEKELAILMRLYRNLYQTIGVIIFVLGCILMFLLPVFINDAQADMQFIYIAYIIQLISTASTYFFAYKRTLVYVDQKQFVCKLADISCNIIFSLIRIWLLIVYRNFHLYLCTQLAQSLTSNLIIAYYCNKHYPFVKTKTKEKYDDIKGMFCDVKNLLIGKVAGYVYSSTDNLVISTFSGIVLAGGFSNYKYVTNAVKNLVNGMTDSITATIGNYIQVNDVEKSYIMFRRYSFIRYCVANVAATGLCICTEAFVGFVFGKEYTLSYSILCLIVVDIFIGIVYGPIAEFTYVLGYFKEEKNINIAGAAINLSLSIILVQFIGVQGVLIGTCVSQIFFWVAKSILLCWKYFCSWKKLREMWVSYIGYVLLTTGQVWLLYVLMQRFLAGNYTVWAFLIEGICSVALSVTAVSICYFRTEQYQYLLNIVKGILRGLLRKNG